MSAEDDDDMYEEDPGEMYEDDEEGGGEEYDGLHEQQQQQSSAPPKLSMDPAYIAQIANPTLLKKDVIRDVVSNSGRNSAVRDIENGNGGGDAELTKQQKAYEEIKRLSNKAFTSSNSYQGRMDERVSAVAGKRKAPVSKAFDFARKRPAGGDDDNFSMGSGSGSKVPRLEIEDEDDAEGYPDGDYEEGSSAGYKGEGAVVPSVRLSPEQERRMLLDKSVELKILKFPPSRAITPEDSLEDVRTIVRMQEYERNYQSYVQAIKQFTYYGAAGMETASNAYTEVPYMQDYSTNILHELQNGGFDDSINPYAASKAASGQFASPELMFALKMGLVAKVTFNNNKKQFEQIAEKKAAEQLKIQNEALAKQVEYEREQFALRKKEREEEERLYRERVELEKREREARRLAEEQRRKDDHGGYSLIQELSGAGKFADDGYNSFLSNEQAARIKYRQEQERKKNRRVSFSSSPVSPSSDGPVTSFPPSQPFSVSSVSDLQQKRAFQHDEGDDEYTIDEIENERVEKSQVRLPPPKRQRQQQQQDDDGEGALDIFA